VLSSYHRQIHAQDSDRWIVCVNVCKELCQVASETKQRSSQWKSPNSPRPKETKQVKS
jgi:hypothetical protein